MASPIGIGVEIGEGQIRVARLRRTSRGLVVTHLGSAPTPDGAMSGASVLEPRLLADGVRRALRVAGLSGGPAVIGLPGRAAACRVLELPAMAAEEMKSVIAGEMEHLRMIPMGQGTFDFLTLTPAEEESRRVRVLVMAADRKTVDSYRDALRLAGVQMLSLEPTFLAASRALFPALEHGGVALVTVGARSSEFSVFSSGQLRYSRQIDVGVLDIARQPSGEAAPFEAPPPPSITGIPTLERSGGDGQTLAFELQRSLDFYHREAPDSERVERVLLAVDTDHVRGLEARLQEALGLPVAVCQPFADLDTADLVRPADAELSLSPGYAPALGLALRAVEDTPRAPRVDLSFTGRESQLARTAPRWLVWATAASVVLVVAAILTLLQMSTTLNRRQAELGTAKVELAQVSQEEQERMAAVGRVREAQSIVQVRGLPWSDILFHVSGSMPEGVWLTSLGAESGSSLTLEGTALSATSVAVLMEALTRSPLFVNPEMRSIQKDTSVASRTLVRYQVRTQLVPPALAPSSAAAPPPPPAALTTSGGAL